MKTISSTRTALEDQLHQVMDDVCTLRLKILSTESSDTETHSDDLQHLRKSLDSLKQKIERAQDELRRSGSDGTSSWKRFEKRMTEQCHELRASCSRMYDEFARRETG